jgi:hypothetical protein
MKNTRTKEGEGIWREFLARRRRDMMGVPSQKERG